MMMGAFDVPAFLGIGDHLRLGKGDLPGKNLMPSMRTVR